MSDIQIDANILLLMSLIIFAMVLGTICLWVWRSKHIINKIPVERQEAFKRMFATYMKDKRFQRLPSLYIMWFYNMFFFYEKLRKFE